VENANQAAFFHGGEVSTVERRSGGAVPRKRRLSLDLIVSNAYFTAFVRDNPATRITKYKEVSE